MADYCTHRKNPPCIQCDSEDHKPSTRDEQAEAFVKNYVTINNRPPHRPDVMKHCYSTGFDAGRANAGELMKRFLEAFYNGGDSEQGNALLKIETFVREWERGE